MYPKHCVWGTHGAKIEEKTLAALKKCKPENVKIVYKGFYKAHDSYGSLPYLNYTNQISPICGCKPNGRGGCLGTMTGSYELYKNSDATPIAIDSNRL
jgi:hypothetical protein